jgi:hypothetical protein
VGEGRTQPDRPLQRAIEHPRFAPSPADGVRLDLELLEERRFGIGVLVLRYGVRGVTRGV